MIVYNMSTFGSVAGGWLSARFLKRGWTLNRARKTAMLICALTVTPIMFAATASRMWVAVALVGIATASHQGWSANLFTLPSDMFPKRAVGSVVGIGGFGGAIGGMVIATFTGFVLQFTGSYVPMFIIAGTVYLIALAIIQWLTPKLGAGGNRHMNLDAFKLTGKNALVTGSRTGLGRAMAIGLAEAGANVMVHGSKEHGLDEVCAAVRSLGGKSGAGDRRLERSGRARAADGRDAR